VSLITLIIVLALIGLLTWAIVTYVPMQANFKKLIIVVVIVVIILWLLQVFGLLPDLNAVRVPKL
jgi:hypothetical protein